MQLRKQISDLDWRVFLLVLTPLSLFAFLSLITNPTTPFSTFLPPLKPFFYNNHHNTINNDNQTITRPGPDPTPPGLTGSRIAVCLVGGARRFELTGPSIVKNVLRVYPNSDLFLHSPFDSNSYKFSFFKNAPRIASVRIFKPEKMKETESQVRVLTSNGSPNGIQGLLQYFNLVEGCLTMINSHQQKNNFTYDWIVRTRVDGYWSEPLGPENFVPGQYIIPSGSSFGGLNDRLGVGDLNTSAAALSRLSLIPTLDAAGFRRLNSETSFRKQLTTLKTQYAARRLPFCVISDRKYRFPPGTYGVPVAAMSSRGPLSGAKCRPCTVACSRRCVAEAMKGMDRGWSWTEWRNGTLDLCDGHRGWERDWERVFDLAAGEELAAARRSVVGLTPEQCVADFEDMRRRTVSWEAPESAEICKVGLTTN